MRKYILKAYRRKRIISFLVVIVFFFTCFPMEILAAGEEPPALPYEKAIYQNGSWMTLWEAGQLFSIYDGSYEIDEDLFINEKTGGNISDLPAIEFRINKDQVLSAIYIPYIYYPLSEVEGAYIEPVYVQLEDDRGNMYGPYLMEGVEQKIVASRNDSIDEVWEDMVDEDEPRLIEAKASRYMYTFRSQGELRLPKGNYTLHTNDSTNLVRTKSSGLEGPVFIKGYEGSAYDKYKEKLLLWNMKNNPELFENKTVIRELVDGEEAESNKIVEEEYTILGNMDLFEYNNEENQENKDYQVQGQEENPPANFPLYISLPGPALIDEIVFNTYNGGLGALPGTVSITGLNDEQNYGNFQAKGKTLQGVPNGMWLVSPGITLPAGEYMVNVSDESVVSSFSDGRTDFYIGASPPPPIEHDFSGTYLINVDTQKTSSIGPGFETGESEDSFSLSSHPITILDRGDHLLMIGSYDGITLSRKSPTGSRTLDSVSTFLEFSLDLSGTPAKTIISAAVDIVLTKPEEGVARMTIGGNASNDRESTEEEGGDYNTYLVSGNGSFAGQDIPPAVLPFMGLAMASAGNIPGPDNLGQAAVGVLFPPLATVLVGLLESLFRRKEEIISHDSDLSLETYDFGDGQEYREGGTYTFDDGGEYILKNGEFELVRQLGEGEQYTNPEGDSKIWSGGQSWHESDLSRQEATNKDYAQAHAEDWENVSSSPDKYVEEAFKNINLQEDLYGDLGRMERAAWRSGMATPGELDDMFSRINELMKDMDAGKPADSEKIQRIRDYMDGRFSGDISLEQDLPRPERYGGLLDMGLLSDTLTESGRNVSNLTTADGSMSWKGFAVRVGSAIVTAGQSEWAFRFTGAAYTMHDAIEAGASDFGALGAGASRVGAEWAISNALAGVMSTISGAGRSGISHLMSTGGSGSGLGSAIISGGSEGASRWGAGMIAQVTDLGSRQAWASQISRITGSITSGVTRMDNLLSGREGLRLPGSTARQMPITAPKKPLNPLEQKQLKDFEKAVRSGDPNQIAKQYANGGMNKLSQIQQKGHITVDTARKANQLLGRQANTAIQQGTKDALKKTQQQTGVRVKELIVGDSGSGAKKTVGRVMTDMDRTLIPRFEEIDLRKYMRANNMTRPQAYNSLCKQFQKNHISSVGENLGKSGLSVDDVGFASYDRIGSLSGQADSYGSRFTNIRQAGSGTSQVYIPDGKGGFRIYNTSGQAAVDQNLLNKQIYGTGTIPSNPLKLMPEDVPSIIKQQAGSFMKSPGDPLAAAKAIGRANQASNIIKSNGILSKSMKDMNGKLVRMANEIYSDPSSINTVLRKNNMNLNQFLKQSKDLLSGYNRTLSGLRN